MRTRDATVALPRVRIGATLGGLISHPRPHGGRAVITDV